MENNNKTLAWKLYEDGRNYNNQLTPNQYDVVETNCEFFAGNQWLHLPDTPAMRGLPKPTFNIIKRVASLFISSLASSGATIHLDPLAYYTTQAVQPFMVSPSGNREQKDVQQGENPKDAVDPDHDAATLANAEIENLLEKLKFDYRIRDALYDGAQTGDYCAHFWYDADARPYGGAFGAHRGEIRMELVDGINVMFGNPNDRNTESQPYILLVGRDTVESLTQEAQRFQKNKGMYKSGTANEHKGDLLKADMQPDIEYDQMIGVGGKTEIQSDDENGKCLYVILYTKVSKEVDQTDPRTGEPVYEDVLDKDGNPVYETGEKGEEVLDATGAPVPKRRKVKMWETTVHVTKATRNAIIYEDVDTGLSRYPIAWGNWEKQKNQYHGRALVTGIIPNQIFINTMFATAMRHMQLMAFPKMVYNADLITQFSNEVGQAIPVRGLPPGSGIPQVAQYLQPAEMSNQIFALIDKVMAYTKECLGATDAQMGNVKPDNTSALMVLQTNAEVPLENIRSGLYEWVEDVGAILLDFMGTYYGERPVVINKEFEELVKGPDGNPMIDPMTGMMRTEKVSRKTVVDFDFSQLKHLWLNLRVDVGATTQFSEIAMTQTLDNLRRDNIITIIQYLERVPDKLIPKKQELLDELKASIAQGQQPGQMGKQGGSVNPIQGGPLSLDKTMQALPGSIQAKYNDLPETAQRAVAKQGALKAK